MVYNIIEYRYTKQINKVIVGFHEDDLDDIRGLKGGAILLLVSPSFEISQGGYEEQHGFLEDIKDTKSETNKRYLNDATDKIFDKPASSTKGK